MKKTKLTKFEIFKTCIYKVLSPDHLDYYLSGLTLKSAANSRTSLLIPNLGAKNLSDLQVMVYTFFLKISMSSFHLEMNYIGAFKYEEIDF